MNPILHAWQKSIKTLEPKNFFNYMTSTVRLFFTSSKTFIANFAWIIVVDSIFLMITGDILSRAITNTESVGQLSAPVLIVLFAHSIIWFIGSSAFFLMLRKDDNREPKHYFRIYFFKYVQALVGISITLLLLLYVVASLGIKKFPTAAWHAMILFKVFEAGIILFWLDSQVTVLNFLKALEKSINFLFYNLPMIILLVAIITLTDLILSTATSQIYGMTINHLFFSSQEHVLLQNQFSQTSLLIYLAIKYGVFFIENFFLSCLVVLYRRKKHERYSNSIFDQPIYED